MKKKGFTLVELLAVIAILAILVIIALPNVMKLFNRAKEQAFTTELKEIYKVAEQQWIADSLFNTQERIYVRTKNNSCEKSLDLSGRSELEYYIKLDKSGNVVLYKATDGSYQYSYSGTGLKIEDIGDVAQISKIEDESNIINISCSDVSGGDEHPVTETIYWALQDNDNDSVNETLIISSNEVDGNKKGSFSGTDEFTSVSNVPWVAAYPSYSTNLSSHVTNVVVESTVAPTSTQSWFCGVGYSSSTLNMNLDNLDTTNVTNMGSMFSSSGYYATTWNVSNLSNWDTSNVTNMQHMFNSSGYNATSFDLDLSKWDTSKVTNMRSMFESSGFRATTWNVGNLSKWDTSSVTNLSRMFYEAGHSATTFNLNLSKWDTSQVTSITDMFSYSGYSATTWSVTIPQTNGNGINNTTRYMYGSTSSVRCGAASTTRSFTLAN